MIDPCLRAPFGDIRIILVNPRRHADGFRNRGFLAALMGRKEGRLGRGGLAAIPPDRPEIAGRVSEICGAHFLGHNLGKGCRNFGACLSTRQRRGNGSVNSGLLAAFRARVKRAASIGGSRALISLGRPGDIGTFVAKLRDPLPGPNSGEECLNLRTFFSRPDALVACGDFGN